MGKITIKDGGTIWGDQLAQMVKERYGETPIFYEVGCFDGSDVDKFLEVLPKADVVAFEGSPITYETYLKDKPYMTCNLAISNINGIRKFFESKERTISSLHFPKHFWKTSQVKLVRLDNFVASYGPIPDVVKIDAEGSTLEVLEGMGDLIGMVKMLYIETEHEKFWKGQKLHKDVVKFLSKKYKCILEHDNQTQSDSIWILK